MNNTRVHPIADQVLVRRDEATRMTQYLHLPDGSEQWSPYGTVLEVGPRVTAPEVQAGIRVLFKPKPASALIRDTREPGQPKEWERVVMLREDDILGIIEDV